MVKRIMKKIYKMGGVILVMVLGSSFSGCSELGSIKSDSDYKNLALETLEERYGEKFEIKQLGGTFGALNDTKKLVCYPSSNPDKYCFVEVEKDLSEVKDDYINRIMEENLNKFLYNKSKLIFGKDINVKSKIGGYYNEYDSVNDNVIDFMNKNYYEDYVINIFIKTDEQINKSNEAEKISGFMGNIKNEGIYNNSIAIFWYIKEEYFNEVDSKYYDLEFEGETIKHFNDKDKIYNFVTVEVEDKKILKDYIDIVNSFK